MIDTLTTDPAAALRLIITAVLFAAIGAVRTVWASRKHGEAWDPGRATGEVVALGLAGAAAGVYVLFTGSGFDTAVFGAAVAVAGIVAREGYAIYNSSREHYGDLRDADVDQATAAILALRHGLEQENPEEVVEAFEALLDMSGKPSRAAGQQRADELADRYREEGARGVADDLREESGAFREPTVDLTEGDEDDTDDRDAALRLTRREAADEDQAGGSDTVVTEGP